MPISKVVTIVYVLALVVLFSPTVSVNGQTVVGRVELLVDRPGSGRTVGMGGIALSDQDGLSAGWNPSGYGFLFKDRFLSVSFPQSTAWLSVFTDDLRVKYSSYGIGYSLSQLHPERESKFDLSAGIAYSKAEFDMGTIIFTDELGGVQLVANPVDELSIYTLGIGLSYFLELGVGFNLKQVSSDFLVGGRPTELIKASTNVNDIAFSARIPIHGLVPDLLTINRQAAKPVSFEITPYYSHVKSGDDNKYLYQSDRVSYAIPEVILNMRGVDLGVRYGTLELLSFEFATEDQEMTVAGELIKTDRDGRELGLGGSLFIRRGSFQTPVYELDVVTKGWGLSGRGILDILIDRKIVRPNDGPLGFVLRRIDIRYDYARYQADGQAIDKTTFKTFSVSL